MRVEWNPFFLYFSPSARRKGDGDAKQQSLFGRQRKRNCLKSETFGVFLFCFFIFFAYKRLARLNKSSSLSIDLSIRFSVRPFFSVWRANFCITVAHLLHDSSIYLITVPSRPHATWKSNGIVSFDILYWCWDILENLCCTHLRTAGVKNHPQTDGRIRWTWYEYGR